MFLKSLFFLQTLFFNLYTFFLVSGSQSYFHCILLTVCVNKSIISETSRYIYLWINKKGNLFNIAFFIVLRSQLLTTPRDENDRFNSKVVIDKLSNSFKVKRIFRKGSKSTLFGVTEI